MPVLLDVLETLVVIEVVTDAVCVCERVFDGVTAWVPVDERVKVLVGVTLELCVCVAVWVIVFDGEID